MGNHTFDRREIEDVIDQPAILRPANYPPGVPGHGWGIFSLKDGRKIAVVSLLGRIYLPDVDCPFRKMNEVLEEIYPQTRNIFVDFHAEVTSEKQAMGWYLDGRVSAVIGTHTHIPTADERILPKGTAYLTDAGMTGPSEGVIGMDKEIIIKKFLTSIPQQFVVAKGNAIIQGCCIELDESSGKAVSLRRIKVPE
jgi:metallophosphoesterase (TIGR00282 family)